MGDVRKHENKKRWYRCRCCCHCHIQNIACPTIVQLYREENKYKEQCVYICLSTLLVVAIICILEEGQNCLDTSGSETVWWVTHVDGVVLSTELLSELRLGRELELSRNGVVGLAEDLDTSTLQVVTGSQLGAGTTTERDRCGTTGRTLRKRVHDEHLNGTGGCSWEIKRELDLPAMVRRKLGHDDEASDLTVLVGGVVVLAMSLILPWVNICEMDLLALAVCQPVLDTAVNLLLDLGWYWCAERVIVHLDTFLARVTDLALDVVIVHSGIVARIQTLFGSD